MSTTLSLSDALNAALEAVASACRVTRHVQQNLATIRQHTKDDRSPVTVADYAAQAVIAAHLRDHLGPLSLLGEEDATTLRQPANESLREAVAAAVRTVWPNASVSAVLDAIDLGNHDASADRFWTLDPVDGTKGFLRNGQYAVSLALIEDGAVVLGVLGCPNLSADFARPFDEPDPIGSLFFATLGGGSWSVSIAAPLHKPIPIHPEHGNDITAMRVCESVEAAHSRLDDTDRVLALLGARGQAARLDSQCKYAVVARGQADVYLRLPTQPGYIERIWDHAAGMLVAQEAGIIVTDIHDRQLDFSHGAGLEKNRGVLCAAPAFHRRVRDAIATLGLYPAR